MHHSSPTRRSSDLWPEESRKNDHPGYSLRREPLGLLSPEWNHCLQKGVRRLWKPAVAQASATPNAGTNTATTTPMSTHKTAKPPAPKLAAEIGRASCRDRVRQYV